MEIGQKSKKIVQQMLARADIIINGTRPWDIQVSNARLYDRVIQHGSLGFGEAYMDGWWECESIDELITRILSADIQKEIKKDWKTLSYIFSQTLLNPQRATKAFEIGERHYDIGNDLYMAMLDARMTYTCAYWEKAKTLDAAQEAKLDLVCKKIGLTSGMTVLDIGCGWGSFAQFAAERYGCKVTGITVSKEQIELGKKRCAGLPVEFVLQDYRDVQGSYDRVVSLGMFEHVGFKNYKTFMEVAHRCLKDDGLFLLHTIGGNTSVKMTDPWIEKYIFPRSMLPSIHQISGAAEQLFVIEDVHSFGPHYDKTLLAWAHNIDTHWKTLKEKYSDRFYRMWKFYLLSCAGSFRSRKNQLWQIVLSKKGVPGGYQSIR